MTEEGKSLNLFPFSRRAIVYLYNNFLQENYRTTRYLLRDVVEKQSEMHCGTLIIFQALGFLIQILIQSLEMISKRPVSQMSSLKECIFLCAFGEMQQRTLIKREKLLI